MPRSDAGSYDGVGATPNAVAILPSVADSAGRRKRIAMGDGVAQLTQCRRLAGDAIDLRRHLALGHQLPQLDVDASAVALGDVVQTVAVTVLPVIDPTVRCVCRPPTFISHRPIV